MRTYLANYQLRNGARGVLPVIARSSCDAILAVIDTFGDELRACSAKAVQ